MPNTALVLLLWWLWFSSVNRYWDVRLKEVSVQMLALQMLEMLYVIFH